MNATNSPKHLADALGDSGNYIRSVFSQGELRVVPRETLATINLPSESREYLASIGLPTFVKRLIDLLSLSFNLVRDKLPNLQQLSVQENFSAPDDRRDYVCLDFHHGGVICIDPSRDGMVMSLDIERDYREDYINSRVEKLGVFLAMYVAHCRSTEEMPPEMRGSCDAVLERFMHAIDPSALSSPNTYWFRIIEEMKYGLL